MGQHIPEEILLKIFLCFELPFTAGHTLAASETSTSLKTLSAITRCSRDFLRIAQPILYKTLYVHSITQCCHLLEVFKRQPALGLHVRHLQVSKAYQITSGATIDKWIEGFEGLSPAELQRRPLWVELQNHTLDDFRHRCAQGKVSVLLIFLQNLEELDLCLGRHHEPISTLFQIVTKDINTYQARLPSSGTPLARLIARLMSTLRFSNLRTVVLSHSSSERTLDRLDATMIPSILRLPNLQALSVKKVSWLTGPTPRLYEAPRLQRLEVDFTQVQMRALLLLLHHCTGIRSLKVTVYEDENGITMTRYLLGQIGATLRHLGYIHLEELDISGLYVPVRGGFDHVFGSLRGLKNLKRLRIAVQDLSGERVHWPKNPHDILTLYDGRRVMNLNAELPLSLESIHFQLRRLDYGLENRYTHNQVAYMITNASRASLREVRFEDPTGYMYIERHGGRNSWRLRGTTNVHALFCWAYAALIQRLNNAT
ncbi:hypothetical protein F5Y13DRAFT_193706 [Hypoxylon sp. FL1857]|nr:hypothetical protein F5Y13DRAFT_193706 [Hypoxylon sp. FL1857]